MMGKTGVDILSVGGVVGHKHMGERVGAAPPVLHRDSKAARLHHFARRRHENHGRLVQTEVVDLEALEQVAVVGKGTPARAELAAGNFKMRMVAQTGDLFELHVVTHGLPAPLSALSLQKKTDASASLRPTMTEILNLTPHGVHSGN